MSYTSFSGVATPKTATNGYYYITASWVPYHIHTARCDHSPCAELGFSTPHNMSYSKTIMVTVKEKKRKKRYRGWVCFTASLPTNANLNILVMFYSVGVNRAQLVYVYLERGGCLFEPKKGIPGQWSSSSEELPVILIFLRVQLF